MLKPWRDYQCAKQQYFGLFLDLAPIFSIGLPIPFCHRLKALKNLILANKTAKILKNGQTDLLF